MSLRTRSYDNEGRPSTRNTLTECPACGYEFEDDESRCNHIWLHSPEDFGMSPFQQE